MNSFFIITVSGMASSLTADRPVLEAYYHTDKVYKLSLYAMNSSPGVKDDSLKLRETQEQSPTEIQS